MVFITFIWILFLCYFGESHPICHGFEASGNCQLKINLIDVPCVSASYGVAASTQLNSISISSGNVNFSKYHGCRQLPKVDQPHAIAIVERGGMVIIVPYHEITILPVCPFSTKANAAAISGYAGLIVLNRKNHPPLLQFGFGDLESSDPIAFPVIAVEENDLNERNLTIKDIIFNSVQGHTTLHIRITFSTADIIKAFLRSATSHLAMWKSRRIAGASDASLMLQRSWSCAIEAENLFSLQNSSVSFPADDKALLSVGADTHFFLGNMHQYHLSPVRPDKAYAHYQQAIALSQAIGEEHLPALTNAAALIYKHSVVPRYAPARKATGVGADDTGDVNTQEIEFVEYKKRAQLEVAKRYAARVEKSLHEISDDSVLLRGKSNTTRILSINVEASLVSDWSREGLSGGTELAIFSLSCDQPNSAGFCLLPIGSCKTSDRAFTLQDGSCVFGQRRPYAADSGDGSNGDWPRPLHLSPRGRGGDPEHDHMFYIDPASSTTQMYAAGVYLCVFRNVVISGAVAVPVTFSLSKAEVESVGNDQLVRLKIWLPSPGAFVPLHTLLDITDVEDDAVVTEVAKQVYSMEIEKVVHNETISPLSTGSLCTDETMTVKAHGPHFHVTVNGVQTSCNNYYHWTTQCFPRILITLELLIGSDLKSSAVHSTVPSAPNDGETLDIIVDVCVLVPAAHDEQSDRTSSFLFVEESLALAGIHNDSIYLSKAAPHMWASLGLSGTQSVSAENWQRVWVRLELVNHHIYRTYAAKNMLQVEWKHLTTPSPKGERNRPNPSGIRNGNGVQGISKQRPLESVMAILAGEVSHHFDDCVLHTVLNSSICDKLWVSESKCWTKYSDTSSSGAQARTEESSLNSLCNCCMLISVLADREGMEFAVPRRVVRFLRSEGRHFAPDISNTVPTVIDPIATREIVQETSTIYETDAVVSVAEIATGLVSAFSPCLHGNESCAVPGVSEDDEVDAQYVLYVSRANGPDVRVQKTLSLKDATRAILNEQEIVDTLLQDLAAINLQQCEGQGRKGQRCRRPELIVVYGDGQCRHKRYKKPLNPQKNNADANTNMPCETARGKSVNSEPGNVCNSLPHKGDELVKHRVLRDKALFARASVVVGVHGAALTNILFARPGTAVVEIVLETTRHRDYM